MSTLKTTVSFETLVYQHPILSTKNKISGSNTKKVEEGTRAFFRISIH